MQKLDDREEWAALPPAPGRGWVAGRRAAVLVLVGAVAVVVALARVAGPMRSDGNPAAGLPSASQSAQVAALQASLPSGQLDPALVLWSSRSGELTGDQLAAIGVQRRSFVPLARGGPVSPVVVSPDRRAAVVSVPFPADTTSTAVLDAVKELRRLDRVGLPPGVRAQVTGGAGFNADIANSFSGADGTLLLVTVGVVALLLLVTYRSPVLWIVPLAVVGLADAVTGSLIAIVSQHTGLAITQATTGIVTVLVFGAGTDYALLLISRYRQELAGEPDHRVALSRAVRATGPAVVASAVTVGLSLLALLLAHLGGTAAIGATAAIGVVVVATFVLVVLPAALALAGRRLFWPLVPRPGGSGRRPGPGWWERAGRAVVRRPVPVVVAGFLGVAALAAIGLSGATIGLSQSQQFRVHAESIDGLQVLSRHFPAGATEPVVVLTTPAADGRVVALATRSPGVASARVSGGDGRTTEVDVTLDASPGTRGSFDAITTLRHRLAPTGALVGGQVAIDLDTQEAAARDFRVVVPVILAVVLIVLAVLLRSAVAPLLLVATVVATMLAATGVGDLLSRAILGTPALAAEIPLLAFLFLVALGVDYNIFLATRAREESATRATADGMVAALAATGTVITSAGILLAAVFAVLAALPVVVLTQLGLIVGTGVLVDTLFVRTALVPALAALLGDRFWWPGRAGGR